MLTTVYGIEPSQVDVLGFKDHFLTQFTWISLTLVPSQTYISVPIDVSGFSCGMAKIGHTQLQQKPSLSIGVVAKSHACLGMAACHPRGVSGKLLTTAVGGCYR